MAGPNVVPFPPGGRRRLSFTERALRLLMLRTRHRRGRTPDAIRDQRLRLLRRLGREHRRLGVTL